MRPMTLLPLLPVLHCVFAPANALEVRGAAPGSCHDATATTLKISWAEEPETDMYYVQLTDTAASDSMPYALQTAATASITLIDLVPDTEYTLSVRSHPSVFNIVWGWRPAGPTFTCKTTPEHVGAPRQLQRVGERPHASEIAVRWRPAQVIGATSNPAHSVGVRVAAEAGARNDSRWNWEKADNATAHTVRNLASGQLYEVAIRDDTSGVVSESLLMRTAAPGVLYTNAYRISEYTFDVDFLDNHDTGTKESIPLYVQNGGGYSELDGEKNAADGHGNHTMDECLKTLESLCPPDQYRGTAFNCTSCADKHREAVEAGCGTWSDADGSDGWFVHFYCGVGWPGSSFQRSPITEYCVEHYAAPQTDPLPGGDGFAQYISCNSDECDGAKLASGGSSPRAPACVCWVWDDRMISHVPKSKLLADCSTDVHLPWVGSNQCNCSHGLPGSDATELPPESPMANYVGRSPVYLPYYHYHTPAESYPVADKAGDNLSFPRKRSCHESQKLGDGGCTWNRLPGSRMLYGKDLLASGWNASVKDSGFGSSVSIKEELEYTYKNVAAFNAALEGLDKWVTPRCCGC